MEVLLDTRLLIWALAETSRLPFDRLLVAQATASGTLLLTSDAALPAYSPLVRLV